MEVIKVEISGITTQYVDKKQFGNQYYLNDKKCLHDPQRFGLTNAKSLTNK